MGPKTCTNKGCGKTYEESENVHTSCEYHSGGPIFHEGLKGWSCCTKRVTDFDEMFKIPGCTVEMHSDAVQQAPTREERQQRLQTEAALQPSHIQNGVEMYGNFTRATPSTNNIAAPSKPVETKSEVKEEDLHDSPDAMIELNTRCKRPGCNTAYKDEGSKLDECIFHRGAPFFHEGSKGWSCCPRKVLEFEEFLKIQGCNRGKHRFTDVKTSNPDEEELIQCRYDWFQTPTTVTISVFAKKVDKSKTKVEFGSNELNVYVKFLDGKAFRLSTPLSQPIKPEESKYEVLSTKVEIVVTKSNGVAWASVEPSSNIQSFTTFGVSGGGGTHGAKQAIVAGDAAILANNRR
ncbi:hypothetical protein SeLEV6574_g05890 [Synchytrium endobioticum]|uniref:Chord-domain-containing protein n=1 Tax=Synchytrium endobioticum TaxID=286115 RepID=A0A507CS36_9FUNG|nr:hypothetical protein SeLEV6574_g05890 [Synchytrium endobioticum]